MNVFKNMLCKEFLISKNINKYKLGEIFFLIAILFLCSSLALAVFFMIPSLIFGTILQLRKKNYFKNPWQFSFFICGILILLNALLQRFILPNAYEEIWDPNLSIIGTANWIPFFWIFWACQPFLDNEKKRKRFSLVLVCGSFPLLLTGFGQYFFNWNGPFETLNGLIVWYQRPHNGNLTGLFNNQNYTGSWLNLVLPFCITLVFEKSKNLINRSFSIFFLIAISSSIILTNSRNALVGLLLVLPLWIGKEGIIFIIFGSFLLFFSLSPTFSGEWQSNLLNLIPNFFVKQFDPSGYAGIESTRLDLITSALTIIKTSPFFGVGAASFTPIYQLETNLYRGHSHNLFTELTLSYGVPVTLIFIVSIISLLIISYKKIFFNKNRFKTINFIDRSYWVSVFFFFISQLSDIQYFEGRISLLIWILLASLKNIIEENKSEQKEYSK